MALTDSLISYWKLDEASGNAADAHGSNTLTDNNTVTSGTGIISNARLFTAANSEYLSHASNAGLSTGDVDFTILCWFKLATGSTLGIIVSKDTDSPGSSREYVIENTNSLGCVFYVNGSAGGMSAGAGFQVTDTNWHQVIAWHDSVGDTLNFQIDNGAPTNIATGGTAPQSGSAEFRIGARQYSGAEAYFDGLIDEVGLWKRVLTSPERDSLWNGGAGLSYDTFGGGGADTPSVIDAITLADTLTTNLRSFINVTE